MMSGRMCVRVFFFGNVWIGLYTRVSTPDLRKSVWVCFFFLHRCVRRVSIHVMSGECVSEFFLFRGCLDFSSHACQHT